MTKTITIISIEGLDVSLLAPCCPATCEYINSAGHRSGIIVLFSIDTDRRAFLSFGAYRQSRSVVRERNARAKRVMGAPEWDCTSIRCLDISLLTPCRATAREHVDRAGSRRGVVSLVAIDAGRDAALMNGAYSQGRT